MAALLAAGCGAGGGAGEAREENHPLMRRALALKQANDVDGAIRLYGEAVARNPGMSRAHLQLAMLFDQEPKEDFVRAVYHYERYMELGREAKTKEHAAELLRRARLSFAASLPDRPSEAVRMIADLKKENALLKEEIVSLQSKAGAAAAATAVRVSTPAPPPASPTAAPATARSRPSTSVPAAATASPARAPASLARPVPAPAVVQAQTYTVQAGDALSTIAVKVYGDSSAWRRIYDANKGLLPDPGSVRPGQVLVIPR
jgi:LysM repeat protein